MITAVSKKPTLGIDETGQPVTNRLYEDTYRLGKSIIAIEDYNQGEFDYFRNNTELMIEATSLNDKLSILYTANARLLGQREMRSKEEIDQLYNQGGNGFLYDKDGNTLNLESDPLIINLDENMKPYLTEDQEKYVDAMIRSNFYNQIGITRDKIRGYVSTGGSGSTKRQSGSYMRGFHVRPQLWHGYCTTKTYKVNGPEGKNYMKQLAYEEYVLSEGYRNGTPDIGQSQYNEYVVGGKTDAPAGYTGKPFASIEKCIWIYDYRYR